jgi:hypothetical protein
MHLLKNNNNNNNNNKSIVCVTPAISCIISYSSFKKIFSYSLYLDNNINSVFTEWIAILCKSHKNYCSGCSEFIKPL